MEYDFDAILQDIDAQLEAPTEQPVTQDNVMDSSLQALDAIAPQEAAATQAAPPVVGDEIDNLLQAVDARVAGNEQEYNALIASGDEPNSTLR